jgi:predicted nucleic acid-binding protein
VRWWTGGKAIDDRAVEERLVGPVIADADVQLYNVAMLAIVVDTSILVAVAVEEATKPALVAATRGAELLAPASVHWEMGNAFSAMLKHKRVTVAQAEAALAVYRLIPVRFVDVDLVEAIRIADAAGIYAYDAYILACSRGTGYPVMSLDRGLLAVAESLAIDIVEVPG